MNYICHNLKNNFFWSKYKNDKRNKKRIDEIQATVKI